MPHLTKSTGLTITNPLVIYRTYLAAKRIENDPAQHRLALHLQELYYRLKDYQPEVDYRHRLSELKNVVGSATFDGAVSEKQARNVTKRQPSVLASWQGKKEKADITALTRTLTDHESAVRLSSPQGMLIYGEVGTGKSMLVDILADCLPTQKKRRWHFNTFMLETFARLEQLRKSRALDIRGQAPKDGHDSEHSLLWLARDMILKSPILFLDEFQLPDRAASKILSNLLISFFHLGGVLIATSNRMPEELANATGTEFTATPSSDPGRLGNIWAALGGANYNSPSNTVSAGKGDFAAFLEVLRARCEIWEMEGVKDWRRRETEEESAFKSQPQAQRSNPSVAGFEGFEPMTSGNLGLGYKRSLRTEPADDSADEQAPHTLRAPNYYFLTPSFQLSEERSREANKALHLAELQSVYGSTKSHSFMEHIPWETTSLRIYGRNLQVQSHLNGVTKWTFSDLCCANLGPADYITLASTFHTFIITNVPILTLLQKNEARRLITLLDALYEARCKLLISAEAGPDHIFFPETRKQDTNTSADGTSSGNEMHSETFSEIYQDSTSPFRPNVSSYTSSASPPSYMGTSLPSSTNQTTASRTILADEDSDFGPVYGARRSHGSSDGIPGAGNEIGRQNEPNFANVGNLTGEDEKFAFKRARSRLWELCGSRWWNRDDEGWWRPLGMEVRRWEGASSESNQPTMTDDLSPPTRNENEEKSEQLFRHGASPFRTNQDPPPKFGWQHAWGMMKWGRKAGAWGKGAEGLKDRKDRIDE